MKKLLGLCILILASSTLAKAQTPASPPNGLSEIAAYSIFYENYKNDNYKSVIQYGRWIWKGLPKTIKGYPKFDLERNLSRLTKAYTEVAKKAEDPSLRSAYLDTVQVIYGKVFNDLDLEKSDLYTWHLERGRFYQENADFIDGANAKAAEDYKKAFVLKPKEFTSLADGYYVQVLVQNMVSEGAKDSALAYIQKVTPYAGDKLKKYFDSVSNQLFSSPTERIAFLESKIEKDPKDEKTMRELRDLYENQGMVNKAQELNEKLYKLNPSFENTKALADFEIHNADYNAAIKYLKEAITKTQDNDQKAELALNLSDAYKNKDNLKEARNYARQAAGLKKNWGQPYLQIASIYAQAVNQCTTGRKMGREDKVVYWLVLDYLDKAKRVDPSVASTVNRQYKSYEPVTPTSEDIFFKGWKKGEKMKVDSSINPCYGWINETTTVR